jgi:MSHA biogenesis protein MshO
MPPSEPRRSAARACRQAGFTLVETVLVIAVTGVLAAVVSSFIVAPVQAYLATSARTALGAQADGALRHMARELRRALPNSVRVTASGLALEFIPTTAAARYATEGTGALQFGVLDTGFDVVGPPLLLAAGQQLVFYNLGEGVVGADAYAPNGTALEQASSNRRGFSNGAGAAGTVALVSAAALPATALAPPYRVMVVDTPVSYRCDLAAGTLTRHAGYGWAATQPNPPVGGSSAVLATGVTACRFGVDGSLVAARAALVTLALTLTTTAAPGGNENATLQQALYVENQP